MVIMLCMLVPEGISYAQKAPPSRPSLGRFLGEATTQSASFLSPSVTWRRFTPYPNWTEQSTSRAWLGRTPKRELPI